MTYIQNFLDSYPIVTKILWFLILYFVLVLIRKLTLNRLYQRLKGSSNWYETQKFARWINNIILLLIFLNIFASDLSGFTTALGFAGAGITYALREVIMSIAGWFAILFGDFFNAGDRIGLGGIKGDVVDISVLRTTLMEIGEWVDGDQYTGRTVRVANSYIFNSPVYNYTGNFEFLWDEIMIPLRFNSDTLLAKEILLDVAETHTGKDKEKAILAWDKMRKQYKLEDSSLENQVYLTFNDNWIEISLRYVVDYHGRRDLKDKLFSEILQRFQKEGDRIEIASETIEVSSGYK